jgi:hypothetical protein
MSNTAPGPISDDELNAMDRRAEEALPGPWAWEPNTPKMNGSTWSMRIAGKPGIRFGVYEYQHGHCNAEFISHARTDVPRLIAEVRRLKAKAGE